MSEQNQLAEALKAGLACAKECKLNTTYHERVMNEALAHLTAQPANPTDTIESLRAERDALKLALPTDHCGIPPKGWRCTRRRGHEGPCAAIQEEQKALQRFQVWADECMARVRKVLKSINAKEGK